MTKKLFLLGACAFALISAPSVSAQATTITSEEAKALKHKSML